MKSPKNRRRKRGLEMMGVGRRKANFLQSMVTLEGPKDEKVAGCVRDASLSDKEEEESWYFIAGNGE